MPPPNGSSKPKFKSIVKTPRLSDLTKVADNPTVTDTKQAEVVELTSEYSIDSLKAAWNEFAESRRSYQAEYHLLTQEYQHNNHVITVTLHNPIEETLLGTFRSDLTTHLRERLKNSRISVVGQLVEEDNRRTLYTNREKLEHLIGRNPHLKELKDRLGLDTDF